MENVMIFESDKFGQIRTAGTSDEPLFCLSDVCKALELQVTPTKNRLKEDGVSLINLTDSLGREQQALFVNEQNLYRVNDNNIWRSGINIVYLQQLLII